MTMYPLVSKRCAYKGTDKNDEKLKMMFLSLNRKVNPIIVFKEYLIVRFDSVTILCTVVIFWS